MCDWKDRIEWWRMCVWCFLSFLQQTGVWENQEIFLTEKKRPLLVDCSLPHIYIHNKTFFEFFCFSIMSMNGVLLAQLMKDMQVCVCFVCEEGRKNYYYYYYYFVNIYMEYIPFVFFFFGYGFLSILMLFVCGYWYMYIYKYIYISRRICIFANNNNNNNNPIWIASNNNKQTSVCLSVCVYIYSQYLRLADSAVCVCVCVCVFWSFIIFPWYTIFLSNFFFVFFGLLRF